MISRNSSAESNRQNQDSVVRKKEVWKLEEEIEKVIENEVALGCCFVVALVVSLSDSVFGLDNMVHGVSFFLVAGLRGSVMSYCS
ncbi:hypothetical protein LWI28_027818 [Acer negundo]|uniref:Uncharacterized protein n=1 Tax=Acer negundo TaxID=4023 RepID=A0AAD5NYS2_ACENE|nr:hypothetical protein LWI28_027818 [Acer negundo]